MSHLKSLSFSRLDIIRFQSTKSRADFVDENVLGGGLDGVAMSDLTLGFTLKIADLQADLPMLPKKKNFILKCPPD